jgi:hypothetical protein
LNGQNDLNLMTMADLNREFTALLPSLVNSLTDEKDRAKLNIAIDFQRLKDSSTGVIVSYSIKPTYPRRAQSLLCRTDLTGNLMADVDTGRQINLPVSVNEEA